VNTCTVTNRTDFKSRNLIRKALHQKELHPGARVVVTGCFAQRSAQEILALGNIDSIIDNQNKLDIATLLNGKELPFTDIMAAQEFVYRPVYNMLGHTRAFQKIQDGCDFFCHYCAVPYARGHSRSARMEDVLAQAQLFADQGFREIVLGGVNLGLYQDGNMRLADVVRELSQLKGIELIRLSSIEPQLFDLALIESIAKIPKLCPQFHIPLQSGSDQVLQMMGRRYQTSEVQTLVHRLIDTFHDPAIGLDVITGYPGETAELFQETYDFIASLPIAYLHVFSYSRRKGTPAAALKAQIDKDEKKQRTAELTTLSHRCTESYRERLIRNQVNLRGVVEKTRDGQSELLSDHYLRILVPGAFRVGELATAKASEVQFLLNSL
jgi:threonylcarbamoyladenosine tRNA methylthiotransferase MtaB